ncbi:MAG: DNA N-6-adenine-methyltransferase [Chthoniobacteraceae bacterium]
MAPKTIPMVKQPFASKFGPALRRARIEAKVTKAAFVEKSGLAEPTLRLLERGRGNLVNFLRALDTLGLEIKCGAIAGKSLGEKLRALRKRHHVSQRELASRLGLTHQTLVRLERTGRGRVETLEGALSILGAGATVLPKKKAASFFAAAGNASSYHGWTTPLWVLRALRKAVGRFDTDPCAPSHSTRKSAVHARVCYTVEDDGLSQNQSWLGKVYVNCPYGREIGEWVAKCRSEAENGNASILIALLPFRAETRWFRESVAGVARLLVFSGRLRFGDGKNSAPFPSVLAVYGGTNEQFDAVCRAFPDAWAIG